MSNNYVITTNEQILVLNWSLTMWKPSIFEELFLLSMSGKDYLVITDYAETRGLLLDKGMMPLAEIEAAGDVYFYGSTLYIVDEKKLGKMSIPDHW